MVGDGSLGRALNQGSHSWVLMILSISRLILRIPAKAPLGLFGTAASGGRTLHTEGKAPSFPLLGRLPPFLESARSREANACPRGKAAWLALSREPPPGPPLPGLVPAAGVRPSEVGPLCQRPGHAPWTRFWFSGADRSTFLRRGQPRHHQSC